MLDGNELMTFGLDDANALNQYGIISVQAKNLKMYAIDFVQNQLVSVTDEASL